MLNLKKYQNDNNYSIFNIETEQGIFQISFMNNLDLYWSYFPKRGITNSPLKKEFIITKENYFIYQLFEELYMAIKNNMPYSNLYYNDKGIIKTKIENAKQPFNNNKVEWHSDELVYDYASYLMIEKNQDIFIVTFHKSKVNSDLITFSIRFNNSGSRYKPFNCTFMSMYNKLCQYDFNCGQMHIEEYIYKNKILKK